MQSQTFIYSEYFLSNLVDYSREVPEKTSSIILSEFSEKKCVDCDLTEKRFLCCVELSRKTNLPADLIKIISGMRMKMRKEDNSNLNTYYRILVYQARLYKENGKKISNVALRRIIREQCSSNKITEPKNLSDKDFIVLIRFAKNTPLTAEEIELSMNYLNDSSKMEFSENKKISQCVGEQQDQIIFKQFYC